MQILGDPQSSRRVALFDDPMASLRVVAVSGETLQTFPLERLEASASKGFGVDAQIAFIRLLFFCHSLFRSLIYYELCRFVYVIHLTPRMA